MKKNINNFLLLLGVFVLSAIFILGDDTKVVAEELNNDNEVVEFLLSEEEFLSKDKIEKEVVINGEVAKLVIEDETLISRAENWPDGRKKKRISATAITGLSMSAVYDITINPYTTTIHSISDGRYNSFLGQMLRDRYVISRKHGSGNTPGEGKYEVDYTTYFGGTLTAAIVVKPFPKGHIAVYLSY